MIRLAISLLTFLILALSSANLLAQFETTKGRTFWCGFLQNSDGRYPGNDERISVFISANRTTSGTVAVPLQNWTRPFTVNAGTTVEIRLPDNIISLTGSDVRRGFGVLIESLDTINVYALNYKRNSADASIILPVNTLRSDYTLMSYWEDMGNGGGLSEFMIVATQDNTEIEISPTANVDGRGPNNYTITLNRGEVYQGQSERDLSGTIIRSVANNCRPFAVFGGNTCTNIGDCGRCDHIFEQIFPNITLGQRYLTVPLLKRSSDIIRIMATEFNTQVTITGRPPFILNAGQFRDIDTDQPLEIRADRPIMVAQMTKGGCCEPDIDCATNEGIYSDPDMLLISPVEQMTITNATVSSFFIDNIKDSFINVITKTANTSLVTRNGNSIASEFRPIPANPAYSYARLEVPKGNHTIRSDSGFIAYVYGFGERDSYSYSGDVMLSNITLQIEGPREVCVGAPAVFKGTARGTVNEWRWNFADGTRATGQNPPPHAFNEPGTYRIMLESVSNQNRCAIDSTFREIRVFQPKLTLTEKKDIPCGTQGGRGTFRITTSNAKPPVIYTLNGILVQENGGFFTVNEVGQYILLARDAMGCTDTLTVNIKRDGNLVLTAEKKDADCGQSNGSIRITVNGGRAPYSFKWATGETTPDLVNIKAGTYAVTATDADGCQGSIDAIEIADRPSPIKINLLGMKPDACNQNTGELTITVEQATAPTRFQWSNGSTEQNPKGLSGGNHTVTVTDSKGCTATATFTVEIQGAPTIALLQTGNITICEGNSTTLTAVVSGLTNNGSLQWLRDGQPIPNANERELTVSQGGTYVLRAIEPPCTTSSSAVTVIQPNIPEIVLTTSPSAVNGKLNVCEGQEVIFTAINVPGATYRWTIDGKVVPGSSSNTLNFEALPGKSGDYVVFVTLNGCVKSSNFIKLQVFESPDVTVNVSGSTVLCNGEKLTLSMAECDPNATYQWSKNGTVIDGTTACNLEVTESGNYTVKVRIDYNLQENNVICEKVSEPINVISNNTEGNIIQARTAPIICEGKTVTLFTTAKPEYTYQWFRDSAPINNATTSEVTVSQAGKYTLRITAGTCSFTSNPYSVITLPGASIAFTTKDNTCSSRPVGAITATVSGGRPPFRYKWSNGGTFTKITNIRGGTYTLTVTDDNGCVFISNPVTITEPPALEAKVDSIKNASCTSNNKGSIYISAKGGVPPYRYTWSNGATNQNLVEVDGGRYSVIITDANNCFQFINNIRLNSPSNIIPKAQMIKPVACYGDSTGQITASVEGGQSPFAYSLDGTNFKTDPQFFNLKAGIYKLYVRDGTGCIVSREVEIGQSDSIVFNIRTKDVTCGASADGSIEVTARGGKKPYFYGLKPVAGGATLFNLHGQYNWLSPGKYVAQVTDSFRCKIFSDTIIIRVNQGQTPTIEFQTVGNAQNQTDSCYTLTNDVADQTGAIWNKQQVNLFKGFDFTFNLNFGNKNNGGDGMVFVLQDVGINAIGQAGKGLGYQGMNRSFGIKFDTHLDDDIQNEIPCDHIAYFKDGITDQPLAGVVQASANDCNIEDGATHRIRVRWDPVNKIVETFFDDVVRMRDTIDLVREVFRGKPTVYWGFTGATGSQSNEQTYCVTDAQIICDCNNFTPAISPAGVKEICAGQSVTFYAPPGFRKYLWSTGDTTQTLTVNYAGTFYVNISDENGCGGNSQASLVVVYPNPTYEIAKIKHVTFGDGYDGELILTGSGGNPPYEYSLDGKQWQSSPEFINIEADTYFVQMKDAKGCTYNRWITVTEPYKFCKRPRKVTVASLTDTSAVITWEHPDNNHPSGYVLFWSQKGTNSWLQVRIPDPKILTYTITGLRAGFTYTVQMKSWCEDIVSINSPVQDFTTPIVCYPPVKVNTRSGQNSIHVSWTQANFAHKYVIAHRLVTGGSWVNDTVPSERLAHTIANLVTKTRYLVKVRTICQFGTSRWGDSVVVFTGAEPMCTTPTNLRHTVLSLEDVRIEWNAVTDAQSYEVLIRELGTADWITIKTDSLLKTIQNLTPGTTYQYRVRAVCGEDLFSMPSTIRAFTLADENCKRPKQIFASPDTTKLYVIWTKSPNATGYQLAWKLKGTNNPWQTADINSPNTLQYIIRNLESGMDYHLRIRSVCSGNEFSTWNDLDARTLYFGNENCRTPRNRTVTDIRSRRVTITWEKVSNAKTYLIRYKKDNTGVWETIATPDNSLTLTGLTPDSFYQYDVQAICSETQSSVPTLIGSFRTKDECAMTTNIEFVNYPTSIKVTWDLVLNAVGYRVFWREKDSNAPFDSVTITPLSTNSYLIKNTKPLAQYEVKVVTLCRNINSEARTAFTATPDLCASPTQLRAKVISESVVQLDWTRSDQAVGYRIRIKPVNGNQAPATFETSFNTYLVSGLDAATSYTAEVITVCKQGITSDASTPVTFKTLGTCPKTTNVLVTAFINNARISWDLVAEAEGYIVNWRKRGTNDNWTAFTVNSKTTNSHLVQNLDPATEYDVQVAVQCADAVSGWTTATFTTLNANGGTLCEAPKGLQNVVIEPYSALLAWNKVSLAVSYEVRIRLSTSNQWKELATRDTSIRVTDLLPNTTYIYQVRTVCTDDRRSVYSMITNFRTPSVCPQVTGVRANASVRNGVVIWDRVNEAVGYQITWQSLDQNTGTKIAEVSGATTFTIPNLNPEENYAVTVVARCGTYLGSGSSTTFRTLAEPRSCEAPNDLRATEITATSITLTWTAVSGIRSYEINIRKGNEAWNTINTNNTTFTVNNLSNNTTYEFRMRSMCNDGSFSNYSLSVFIRTSNDCAVPQDLLVSGIRSNSAVVTWRNMPKSVNTIIGYRLTTSNVWTQETLAVNLRSFTLTGLRSGVSYEVRIMANCADFASDWSSPVNFRTLSGKESEVADPMPVHLSVYPNPNKGTFEVQWTGANDAWLNFKLTDLLGKTLWMNQAPTAEGKLIQTITLPDVAKGVYLFEVSDGKSRQTVKLMID